MRLPEFGRIDTMNNDFAFEVELIKLVEIYVDYIRTLVANGVDEEIDAP